MLENGCEASSSKHYDLRLETQTLVSCSDAHTQALVFESYNLSNDLWGNRYISIGQNKSGRLDSY